MRRRVLAYSYNAARCRCVYRCRYHSLAVGQQLTFEHFITTFDDRFCRCTDMLLQRQIEVGGQRQTLTYLAAYYTLGGAHSLQLGDHVRMDLIYDNLSEKGKARMDVATSVFILFYLGVLLNGAISSTMYSLQYNQKLMSVWAPPVAPIKLVMVFGIILMILQMLAILFKDIATARGQTIPGVKMHEEQAI